MRIIAFWCGVFLLDAACAKTEDSPVLSRIIESLPAPLAAVAHDPAHELQVFYVQIDEGSSGPTFTEHAWHLDANQYFYPASTVKFPAALFALEKLAGLGVEGLDRDTAMLTGKARPWQTERTQDASAGSGRPSVAHDLRMIFLVSDNDAYNRQFEFVGSQVIRERCDALGMVDTHIFHRLAIGRAPGRGRYGNPVRFLDGAGEVLHAQPESIAPEVYGHARTIRQGRGYLKGGALVEEPMEFSDLNAFPLADQHRLLREVFFPSGDGLRLDAGDRKFVQELMGQFPRECKQLADGDDSDEIRAKPDHYVKNFLRWNEHPIRDSLRCYNKSGRAYGYLTDNAYIIDREHGVAFFLAATIHVNANQIYNDDVYEYETIGEPFMAALGKAIYDLERKR